MRVLTPTENNRLNELIGFLGVTIAVLMALALISYSPHDPSFNVSAESSGVHAARNWVGPVGAYSADLLFQGFGYAVFLLPVGIFVLGSRWFRSEAMESPVMKIVGYSMLVLMAPTLLTLCGMFRTFEERFRRAAFWDTWFPRACALRSTRSEPMWSRWRFFSSRFF